MLTPKNFFGVFCFVYVNCPMFANKINFLCATQYIHTYMLVSIMKK